MMGDEYTQGLFDCPELTPPIEPDQLLFAAELAGSMHAGRTPSSSPSDYGLTADIPGVVLGGQRFCETVDDHIALALMQHFWPDRQLCKSVILRFRALNHIWGDARFEELIDDPDPQSEQIGVRLEVFDVAASMPLDFEGEFDKDEFFVRVARVLKPVPSGEQRAA
ncbi:MAG: hypothetical protein ABIK85_06120 [Candidatus Eisenbacteria bacterium]